MSCAMMAVTGALIVLSTLPGASAGRSRSLACWLRTNTMRAGEQLALVGAIFMRSYSARNCSSETGRGSQPLWVRAALKSWSSATESRGAVMR